VDPWVRELPGPTLDALLALIGVDADALDPRHPPRLAFAGNPHPLIVLREAGAFDDFSFDAARARQLMDAEGWPATVIVLHDLGRGRWESRNIFPVGTLSEDPATGAGAAATGGYLRAMGAVRPPARIEIEQGRHVGRPGLLVVDIPPTGGVTVTGSAVPIH
jgi:PhzF family phenazine biosynthesis protein